MSKVLRTCLIWGLLLGVNSPAAAKPAAKTEGEAGLEITVLVYDTVGLPAELLSRSLNQTKAIFGDAGVVVVPIICTQTEPPGDCHRPLDPLTIALRIVPKAVPGSGYEMLGCAFGQYLTVIYPRVEELAEGSDVFLERILGCVVAHELGHVLLGPHSHSVAGIMTARLTEKELRVMRMMPLRFLPSQKERIRAYMLSQSRNLVRGSIAMNQ
jgi:hypothetical protein